MSEPLDSTTRNETASEATESRFRDLVRSLRVGLVITGPDAVVRAANPAAAEILGVAESQLLGTSSYDPRWKPIQEDGSPCRPEDHPIVRAINTRQTVRNVLLGMPGLNRRHIVWVLVDAAPRLSSDGSVSEVICSFSDVSSRIDAEQALRENMASFQQLVEALQGVMTLYTADMSQLLYVSPQYETVWGRSCASLYDAPDSWLEGVHPGDLPMVLDALARLRRGDRFDVEHRIVRPGGSVRWVSRWGNPIRDERGTVCRVAGSARDITDRKQAEDARRSSEARFALLAGRLPAIIWTTDRELRFTSGAGAALAELGLQENQLVGTSVFDYLRVTTPDDPAITGHRRAIAGETVTFDYEWSGHTYQVQLAPLTKESEIIGATGVAVDVSSRKSAEAESREWSERYDAAVRATRQILYDWNAKTGEVFYGGNLGPILGYSSEEMSGGLARWTQLIHPEDRDSFREQVEQSWKTKIPAHQRYRLATKSGKYIDVQDDASFVFDSAGNIARAVGFVADLSERKHLEDQLRQAQKMEAIGRLAGGVAHDFNNLLTVILGYTDALRTDLTDALGTSSLDEIEKAATRAERLTRQLLAFSRRQVLQFTVLDLNEVVLETEQMLRRLIGEDIELRTRLAPRLGHVKADRAQVQQAIVNLAVNGRDAMPNGGTLSIETAHVEFGDGLAEGPIIPPGRYVLLEISDTGLGMDSETQAHIFEPFFTTKGPGEGTGLGLSMVYGIVKQSSGHIEVDSEPGRGTRFRIYFPRVELPAETKTERKLSRERPSGNETILIVEDEDAVRRLIESALRDAGYTVLAARTGHEALEISRGRGANLALMVTDVIMPGMSGAELAARMAADQPGLRVLYISGYADDALLRHGIQAGSAFLSKPFTPSALALKVRELLDQAP